MHTLAQEDESRRIFAYLLLDPEAQALTAEMTVGTVKDLIILMLKAQEHVKGEQT